MPERRNEFRVLKWIANSSSIIVMYMSFSPTKQVGFKTQASYRDTG